MNDKVTTDDLLHLLLIASDNAAARALARVSPQGSDGFIERMNEKASNSVCRARTTPIRRACCPTTCRRRTTWRASSRTRRPTSASARSCGRREYTVHVEARDRSRSAARTICSAATDVDVRAAKTGFISKSGYCLATLLRLPQGGQQVAVVVLGARSNAGRFIETQNLFNWLSVEGLDDLRHADDAVPVQQQTRPPTLRRRSPCCIAAASSGSVAIVSTDTITGRDAFRASYAFRYLRQTSHAYTR